jgi:hypothetical protein
VNLPRFRFHRCSPSLLAWGGIIALAGCSGSTGPVCYPVQGQVTLDGKPLVEAMVVLHPLSGMVDGGQKPIASTDAEGRFATTTFQSGDGAPPGDYAITVELRAQRMAGEELIRDGRNMLPPRYARPESSGFRCTVGEGENELPPIDLLQK